MCMSHIYFHFFFFNDTATTEIYTLSLHDALPIYDEHQESDQGQVRAQIVRLQQVDRELARLRADDASHQATGEHERSEEHTSELQSQSNLVCRLLLEKKKNK